jgi:hypothetical protein
LASQCGRLRPSQRWPLFDMAGCARRPKSESRDRYVSGMFSLQLQVSNSRFQGKVRNSPNISKGISRLGMFKFESSQVSQPVPRPEVPPLNEQKSPLLAGFCIRRRSLNSQKGELAGHSGKSLRRLPRIFPFCRDFWRRPGSITTAGHGPQSNSPFSPLQERLYWAPYCRARAAN